MDFQTRINDSVPEAKYWLESGELVAVPTETVYGLAANALDQQAVAKVFAVKNRPHFDPLIVHVHSIEQVYHHVLDFPEALQALADAFWPGPLTLLLLKNETIPDIVTAGLPTVGIRMPRQDVTLELLRQLDFPLAAPSANPFGYISPTQPSHVMDQLGGKIPFILDGGPCQIGIESTIVSWEDQEVHIHRPGGITQEELARLGYPVRMVQAENDSKVVAPGNLGSHYAPAKPLEFRTDFPEASNMHVAVIAFDKPVAQIDAVHQYILSPKGDLVEAAKNLFATLRLLDTSDYDLIWALPFPETGLGVAINDRLRRAAHKR